MSNRAIYAVGTLLAFITIGMLLGSFRLIIYPYICILGLLFISGIGQSMKMNKKIRRFPLILTVLFLILFIGLDYVTLDSPIGDGDLFFGLSSSSAIYYLGIWILCLIVSMIYAWAFKQQDSKYYAVNSKSMDMEEKSV
jgi:hypothetical protein